METSFEAHEFMRKFLFEVVNNFYGGDANELY